MTSIILFLFVVLNLTWAFIAYALTYDEGIELTLFGWQTGFAPQSYMLTAVLILIVLQVFLIAWILYLRSRSSSLAGRYRQEKTERQELQKTLSEKQSKLDQASDIDEKFSALSEKSATLEEWNEKLTTQNEELAVENERLQKLVEETSSDDSLLSRIKTYMGV